MASKTSHPASKHQEQPREETKDDALTKVVDRFSKKIHADRGEYVKEKIQGHRKNLDSLFSMIESVIFGRESLQTEKNVNMLSSKIANPLCKLNGFPKGMVEKDRINNVDLSGAKSIKISQVEKIPPYISWEYVARNERMAKDQSVIGKRQMYFDKNRGEMVICSDSEEETEFKHDFTEAEDQILRMTLEEYESTGEVMSIVKESIKTTDSQIKERYATLKEKNMQSLDLISGACNCRGCKSHLGICLEKSLSDTLETFDILFCRQCYSEKQPIWSEAENDRKPCSDQCYLLDKVVDGQKDLPNEIECNQVSSSMEIEADEMTSNSDWTPLERDLYLKGLELFGKNSCLIARILLSDLKTCLEVAKYMFAGGGSMPRGSIPSSMREKNENNDEECIDEEMAAKGKRGRPRKMNYCRKPAGVPPRLRKIAYGENMLPKQYTPCACYGMCGKDCPCLLNGTCCEKYCGCFKLCNNRFRGCYCVKSQCKSRICPCFAAKRECDPDVCQNCWVSCGDGTLGEPPRCGDGQCENMNLLLGQKQRILLAKSNVAGWGAFAKVEMFVLVYFQIIIVCFFHKFEHSCNLDEGVQRSNVN
ncbi:hypothetical protein Fmac_006767 [Flemingia macrophylla]|uniref:CXC domain-containing protein n=1 Tax=Flemingia macrophylla TaxID=520843 RepID=A0ABD1NCR6_9FABA